MAIGKYQRWLEPEGITLLEGWARDGLTDEQIANNMAISPSTLRDWKAKFPPISAALKKGKEWADIQVENALFKRALGYDYMETTTRYSKSGEQTSAVTVNRHVPGDTTAQIFWLKNRRPDKWRNNPEAVGGTGQKDAHKALLEAIKDRGHGD